MCEPLPPFIKIDFPWTELLLAMPMVHAFSLRCDDKERKKTFYVVYVSVPFSFLLIFQLLCLRFSDYGICIASTTRRQKKSERARQNHGQAEYNVYIREHTHMRAHTDFSTQVILFAYFYCQFTFMDIFVRNIFVFSLCVLESKLCGLSIKAIYGNCALF